MGTTPTGQPVSADPVQVDPKHYKVELENDRVRVLRIRYGPREKSVMHGHPAGLAVFLTDQRSKFTYPDGTSEEVVGEAGRVRWLDAFQHLPENASDQSFELIRVDLG